jgi:hypothetical protein
MRGYSLASLCIFLIASSALAQSQPENRPDAATMDPYMPIRNTALQFDLGVDYSSVPGYFASKTVDTSGTTTGSDAVKFQSAGSLTQFTLRVHHGFAASTEAILEIPYILATGDARRPDPGSSANGILTSGGDTSASGFGDWTLGLKSAYEPWGLGGYFALVLPVGAALGSGAYTDGDGQINGGIFWDKVFAEKYQILTNFVYGYDLPATNRQLDKQDNYSYYLRLGYLLDQQKYRPYVAFTYKGYGEYTINNANTAPGSDQMVVTPGIDLNLTGDFSSEIKFDYTVAGSGNRTIATPSGWKISANLKYFWFRF